MLPDNNTRDYPEEINAASNETADSSSKVSKKKGKKQRKQLSQKAKKRLSSLLGALLIFFTIVGMVSSVTTVVKFTKNLIENTSQKEKYEDFLMPIVMLDPVYFDSASKAGQPFLIQSSLWYLIYNKGVNYYATDDIGNIMIPASDAEVAAGTLFGSGIELLHQSVGDITNLTTYTEDTSSYHLPLATGLNCYTPLVDRISKSGDTITLTVGYIQPSPNWGDKSESFTVPDKFAYYILKESDGNLTLVAIKEMSSDNQAALIEKYKAKS